MKNRWYNLKLFVVFLKREFKMEKLIIGIKPAAKFLKCDPCTIFRMMKAGEFPEADYKEGSRKIWHEKTLKKTN